MPFSPSQRRRFPEAAAETPRSGKHCQHGRENRRRPGGGLFVWLEVPGVSDLGCCLSENHPFLEGLRKTRELEHSNFESSFGQLMLIQSPYIYIYICILYTVIHILATSCYSRNMFCWFDSPVGQPSLRTQRAKDIHILDLLELCTQLPPRSKAVGMMLGQGPLVTSQTSLTEDG